MDDKREQALSRFVVKSNDLVQRSRYKMTLNQQKIILYIISKIKPDDDDFRLYDFRISDFCELCGIDKGNGEHYRAIKRAIKEIADVSVWVTIPSGEKTLVRWIEKPYINRNSGTIRIRFDRDMKPFLLQLNERFTRYELGWALQFRSKYSIRLYELIKSVYDGSEDFFGTYTQIFKLEDLQAMLGAETYKSYTHFKQKVLDPAVAEISADSDMTVKYYPIKEGRSVAFIKLDMIMKSSVEKMALWDNK